MSISRASVTKKTDITINVIAYGNLLLQHRVTQAHCKRQGNVHVECNERERRNEKKPFGRTFLVFLACKQYFDKVY